MTKPPKSYWHDVNRHYGEIMSRTKEVRLGFWLFGLLTRESTWDSSTTPGATTTLSGARVCMFGRVLKGPVRPNLSIESPTVGPQVNTGYAISFDPKAEVIHRAFSESAYDKIPEEGLSLKGVFSYFRQYNQADAELKGLGLDVPGPKDYEILLAELQRGAETLPFTSDP